MKMDPKIQKLVGDIIHPYAYKFMELLKLEKGDNDINYHKCQLSYSAQIAYKLQLQSQSRSLQKWCLTTGHSPQQAKSSVQNCGLLELHGAQNHRGALI